MTHELRFRQIHLDFHTSEHVPGIGSDFDPDAFVATLKKGHVDSVTLFSRCHHGWIYHDTKFPNRHPHLTCDLLTEQIKACHAADIRCPVYITVGWDEYAGRTHPEWLEVDANGKMGTRLPLNSAWGWAKLCFASPYIDHVIEQTLEVVEKYGDELDGLFFDIIHQFHVHSVWCLAEYERRGWDPTSPEDQEKLCKALKREAVERISKAVWDKNPNLTIFHNAGHVDPHFKPATKWMSHLEVESLPTGGWGYAHFPMTARYTRTLGLDFMGMTGKFAESWGHFNSYKSKAALEYECVSALALGGKCSVGDQLHPSGVLDEATYDLIGSVYAQVEALEPWCRGARGVAEIAVLNAEEFNHTLERIDPANLGATRMLLESRHQFDLIDRETDLSAYKVIILPDVIPTDGAFAQKLDAFVAAGGAILASGKSGFGLADFPAVATGRDLEFSPDFLRTDLAGYPDTPYVMYERGVEVDAAPGAQVRGTITEPYFERAWNHFVSHAHTPPARDTDRPAITQKGRVVHFAHPVFTTYVQHSMPFHRDVVLAVLDELLPDPLLRVEGPTSMQATLTKLPDGRHGLFVMHYVSERRGLRIDVVEDRLPLHEVPVSVKGSWSATMRPQGATLEVTTKDGRTEFTIPKVDGYQFVELTPA